MAPFAFATASSIRFGRGTFRDLPGPAAGQGRRVLLLRSASVGQAEGLARALRQTGAALEMIARGEPDLPARRRRAVNAVPGVCT